jgi:hypothetical protein
VARIPKITPPCKVADLNENIANARLIAAAPELLEALHWVAEFGTREPLTACVAKFVTDTIAKATGEGQP